MDYFLQVFTIAYTLITAYSSIKLYKLRQANFSHPQISISTKLKVMWTCEKFSLNFPTYIFNIFSRIQISASLGKMGLDQYQLHIHL